VCVVVVVGCLVLDQLSAFLRRVVCKTSGKVVVGGNERVKED